MEIKTFKGWVTLGLIIYLVVMVIILAFVWKYQPIWLTVLLGLYGLVSFVAGIALAYLAANKILKKKAE